MSAHFSGLAEALRELRQGVERATRATLEAHADRIAGIARADHPYQDRTGRLTRSLKRGRATGHALDGSLSVYVGAWTEYASFVEYGTVRARPYPYLEPAAVEAEPYLTLEADQAFRRAFP